MELKKIHMPKQNLISFALYQQRVLSCCLCESPSCPTLCNPIDYTARILKWVSFPFSRGSSQPRDWTQASHTAGGFFISWATREAHCLCGPDINWSSAKMLIRDAAHPFVSLLLPPACWAEESIPINHPLGPQRPTLRIEVTAFDDVITFNVKFFSQFLSRERERGHFYSSSHRDSEYFMLVE